MTGYVLWRWAALAALRVSLWLGHFGAWCTRRAVAAGCRAGSTVRVVVDLDGGRTELRAARRRRAPLDHKEGIGC